MVQILLDMGLRFVHRAFVQTSGLQPVTKPFDLVLIGLHGAFGIDMLFGMVNGLNLGRGCTLLAELLSLLPCSFLVCVLAVSVVFHFAQTGLHLETDAFCSCHAVSPFFVDWVF
jgi:hypothetical protein